jgi:cytochrome c peroxidase
MAISSQNLKEILESFKAQLFHTLDDRLDAFVHGLTDSLTNSQTASMIVFVVFKIH